MKYGTLIISRINNYSCPVSNSHQHHFEDRDGYFWCRLCGFFVEEGNSNFLYLKRKMDKLNNKEVKPIVSLKRSPIKKKVKRVIQDGEDLTQKEAFLVAYVKGGKKWFLTNKPVSIEELTASNFAHVLSKKQYKWFKYYWKNIRIIPSEVHHIFDQGTADQYQAMLDNFTPQERYNWDRFIKLREELNQEYNEWIKTNPKEYKL